MTLKGAVIVLMIWAVLTAAVLLERRAEYGGIATCSAARTKNCEWMPDPNPYIPAYLQ